MIAWPHRVLRPRMIAEPDSARSRFMQVSTIHRDMDQDGRYYTVRPFNV
jgi:hypothetical protein